MSKTPLRKKMMKTDLFICFLYFFGSDATYLIIIIVHIHMYICMCAARFWSINLINNSLRDEWSFNRDLARDRAISTRHLSRFYFISINNLVHLSRDIYVIRLNKHAFSRLHFEISTRRWNVCERLSLKEKIPVCGNHCFTNCDDVFLIREIPTRRAVNFRTYIRALCKHIIRMR